MSSESEQLKLRNLINLRYFEDEFKYSYVDGISPFLLADECFSDVFTVKTDQFNKVYLSDNIYALGDCALINGDKNYPDGTLNRTLYSGKIKLLKWKAKIKLIDGLKTIIDQRILIQFSISSSGF